MIPTLLLVGLVAGLLPRPWLCVAIAAIAWPLVLLGTSVVSGPASIPVAAALAAANTVAGTVVARSLRVAFTRLDRKPR